MNFDFLIPDISPEDSDYTGDDGLVHCGVCHEPKQAYFDTGLEIGNRNWHPRQCACKRKAREEEDAREKERKHMLITEELRRDCFGPSIFKDCRFENLPKDTPQLKLCLTYAEHFEEFEKRPNGMLLWGDVGTGKTSMAACIANYLIDHEISVRMINLSSVFLMNADEKKEYIDKILAARLLILDDFGQERETSFGHELVFHVINERSIRGKPMIITTNLGLETLKTPPDTAHKSIYDRVLSKNQIVSFPGRSKRHQNRQNDREFMLSLLT